MNIMKQLCHLRNTLACMDTRTFQATVVRNNKISSDHRRVVCLRYRSDCCECESMLLLLQLACYAHADVRHGNLGNNSLGSSLNVCKRFSVHLFFITSAWLHENNTICDTQ